MPLLNRRRSASKRSRDAGEHKRRAPKRARPRPQSGQPPIISVEDATVVYPAVFLIARVAYHRPDLLAYF